jgi:F-type H+/Na+-transporting ATPase subunit alpha
VNDVVRYEAAMLAFLRKDHADILGTIRESKDFSDDTKAKLKAALDQFGKTFA